MVASLFVEDCGPVVICLDLRGRSNGEQPMHGQLRDKISGVITACCFSRDSHVLGAIQWMQVFGSIHRCRKTMTRVGGAWKSFDLPQALIVTCQFALSPLAALIDAFLLIKKTSVLHQGSHP